MKWFKGNFLRLIKQVAAGVCLIAVVSSAYAIDVSNYLSDATVTNVYATITHNTGLLLERLFINDSSAPAICDATAGTIDIYSDMAYFENPLREFFVYCKPIAALKLPGNIAVFVSSNPSSSKMALSPLIEIAKAGSGAANTASFFLPQRLVDGACDAPISGALRNVQPYTFHGHCMSEPGTPDVVLTGSISDVEAPLIGISSSDANSLLYQTPGVAVVWVVAVNKPFYRALQTSQGLANTDTPATVPSLTRAQIAAIYSQQITDPAQIVGANSAPIRTPGSILGVCRQQFGSGAEAAAEEQWLGQGCTTSDLVIPAGDNINVFENQSDSVVGFCLTALDLGGTVNLVSLPAAGRFAIGIMSSENGPSLFGPDPLSPFSDDVRVIAVDGALPTLENVANGSYPFFTEDVLYRIASPGLYHPPASTVWDAVTAYFGHPFSVGLNNQQAFRNYWGQAGDLAVPTNFSPPVSTTQIPATFTSMETNPLNTLTKSSTGIVNNCDPAVLWGSSTTATYQFLNQ